MVWNPNDPQGWESGKIKYEIVKYTRGKVLDLGCGPWKAFPHFIGMDNITEWSGYGYTPDLTGDCTNLSMFASKSMDAVFSSHLLEHIENTEKTLKEWWRVIKLGGHLILYLPHKNYYPNIGQPGANEDHKHDFLPRNIISVMKNIGHWDLEVCEERNQDKEYSFLQVFRKTDKKEWMHSWTKPKAKKTCGVVRYGGFGDMIQASSVFPGLKRQGYHVTVYTTPKGYSILKNDPNIDDFYIQDDNQVPLGELFGFWDVQKKKFDKWVNLSESVEATFLSVPDRPSYYWPKKARHRLFDVNYTEFVHDLAEIPFTKPYSAFYPEPHEVKWAEKQRKKINGLAVLWCVDGSSLHKHWPYMDSAIARMMLMDKSTHVILCGNALSSLLERGWENEPRVWKRCDEWDVRKTMAFAQQCDVVIGPETGILNAVGQHPVKKICFLSHSTIENLTKHWTNCYSMVPKDCKCYPCHQMHYTWEHCNRNDIGGADCQCKIDVTDFWRGFIDAIKERNAA